MFAYFHFSSIYHISRGQSLLLQTPSFQARNQNDGDYPNNLYCIIASDGDVIVMVTILVCLFVTACLLRIDGKNYASFWLKLIFDWKRNWWSSEMVLRFE